MYEMSYEQTQGSAPSLRLTITDSFISGLCSALVNTHACLAAMSLRCAFRNVDGCNACHFPSQMSISMREVSWTRHCALQVLSNVDSPCNQNVYNTIMERSSGCLITNNVQLGFVPESYWNLDFITQDFAQWMSNQQLTPTSTSRVGILSSFNLTRLLSISTPGDMSQNFRLFVETSLALYNRGFHQGYASTLYNHGFQQEYAGYNLVDLWRIRSFAGNKVLDGLQGVLKNNALSRAPLSELKALFLVLFGTIVSVGYSGQMTQSGIVSLVVRSQISNADQWGRPRRLDSQPANL